MKELKKPAYQLRVKTAYFPWKK